MTNINLKYFTTAMLAATLSVTPMLAAPANASISMNWPEYAREILLNNQSLRNGVKNVEAAYYSVLAAVGTQRPNVGITGYGAWATEQQGESNVMAGNAILTLSQRIDITGKYTLDEQQYILGYEIARAQFDAGLNTLLASAEEAWWGAVLARENVNLQREILRQRSENHRITMEKYRQELVPRLDIVRSEAQVVQAETLVKNAETTYQNVLANLSYLAGGLDVEPVDTALKVPDFDVTMSYEDALTYRPDVRAARLSIERAKLVKKLRSKGLNPTLDFKVQYTGWSDPEVAATPNNHELGAAITLNIPIFDGKQTKFSTINSDRLLQAAEANLEAVQEETRRDITVAMNNWRNSAAMEIDKKRQVERSEEELRITKLMYSEGMGAQIDLINAQTDYQSVRTQYLDSVRGMYVALVALRKAIGDYAPDEDGTWTEAVARYGKGNNIIGEVGLKNLRDQRGKKVTEKPGSDADKDIDARLRELSEASSSDASTMTVSELDARLREIDEGK